ncbi:hypothetical protein CXG81DRAFT_8655 [Caulochytrium protostelioides]|uniref:Prolyl endopeptidase n=1 Tax=Caulochytrium protostelioides TaxID=1555241 RepID=A0A4P9XG49_9FUNG|nr:hypothetical protein CXG81DRAFT_8655 [Caulochytrium protostelioides]|eukprot:RKP04150.1 hypothetical protein CXG81DRAFT_8655 [Caulochytrium protostelioides]
MAPTIEYPAVRRSDKVLTMHGESIPDPYEWLGDPWSEEVQRFVEQQNALLQSRLSAAEGRAAFKERLTEMFDYRRIDVPFKEGEGAHAAYYHFANTGLQPQSVLYRRVALDDEPKVFFDPNALSEDGTISIVTYRFSKSGKYWAYALSQSGSDWVKVYVGTTDGTSETVEAKPLEWVKFSSLTWTDDDAGFLYKRYPKPKSLADREQQEQQADDKKPGHDAGTETDINLAPQIYYHKLNTPQSEDLLIYEDPDHPDIQIGQELTTDGAHLLVSEGHGCDPETKVYYAETVAVLAAAAGPTKSGKSAFRPIVDDFEAAYDYIATHDGYLYFSTSYKAPKRRIVRWSIADAKVGHGAMQDVLPETEDLLEMCRVINEHRLVVIYLHNVSHVIKVYDLRDMAKSPLELPIALGSSVISLSGRKRQTELFYRYMNFTSPGVVMRFDATTDTTTQFDETKVPGLDRSKFEVRQVMYKSKDGTSIPMFLIGPANKPTGPRPIWLYGYGGFNASITPAFSVFYLALIEKLGATVAIANLRGGGEFGDEWHRAGKGYNKQNVFDDFAAAARYLVDEGLTTVEQLCINGASNGGLLVGASITQHPELFGCAIADVGVHDMLKFAKQTIGHAWTTDYLDPDSDKKAFDFLRGYSPCHNVPMGVTMPWVLVTTGDHDDRVVPMHSHTFAAQLQHAHTDRSDGRPRLMRITTKAGHGAGRSTAQRIEEMTDKYAFWSLALDHYAKEAK